MYGYVLNDPLERLDEVHLLESSLSVWNRPIRSMSCRVNGTIAALSRHARLLSVCIDLPFHKKPELVPPTFVHTN